MSWTRARASARSSLRSSVGGDGAGNLRNLHGVGQAGAKVVGGARGEDLGLAGETAKGAGLDDALAIALEGSAIDVGRSREGAGLQECVEVGDGLRIGGREHGALPFYRMVVRLRPGSKTVELSLDTPSFR